MYLADNLVDHLANNLTLILAHNLAESLADKLNDNLADNCCKSNRNVIEILLHLFFYILAITALSITDNLTSSL